MRVTDDAELARAGARRGSDKYGAEWHFDVADGAFTHQPAAARPTCSASSRPSRTPSARIRTATPATASPDRARVPSARVEHAAGRAGRAARHVAPRPAHRRPAARRPPTGGAGHRSSGTSPARLTLAARAADARVVARAGHADVGRADAAGVTPPAIRRCRRATADAGWTVCFEDGRRVPPRGARRPGRPPVPRRHVPRRRRRRRRPVARCASCGTSPARPRTAACSPAAPGADHAVAPWRRPRRARLPAEGDHHGTTGRHRRLPGRARRRDATPSAPCSAGRPASHLVTVGERVGDRRRTGRRPASSTRTFDDVRHADVVVVPGGLGSHRHPEIARVDPRRPTRRGCSPARPARRCSPRPGCCAAARRRPTGWPGRCSSATASPCRHERVVVDGPFVTCTGLGSAFDAAFMPSSGACGGPDRRRRTSATMLAAAPAEEPPGATAPHAATGPGRAAGPPAARRAGGRAGRRGRAGGASRPRRR